MLFPIVTLTVPPVPAVVVTREPEIRYIPVAFAAIV